MLRYVLIGLGVVTTAIGGYFAKKKFLRPVGSAEGLKIYRPTPRTRKSRRLHVYQGMENGELTQEP